MIDKANENESSSSKDFREQAHGPQRGIAWELWVFLATNKRWWLTPIIVVLLLLGALLMLGSTAAAPFIYTLF